MPPVAHQRRLLQKRMRKWSVSKVLLAALGPDDVAERRVLEDALAKVRARAIVAPIGQRLVECEKFCERAAKRVDKVQEAMGEALKV